MAQATTNTNLDFAVGSANDDATHWTLWDASSSGNLLWSDTIVGNPDPLAANQFYRITAGSITLTVPAGADGATEEMARRAVRGMISGTVYLQLHDGAPGGSGTSNILTSARVSVAAGNWTVT